MSEEERKACQKCSKAPATVLLTEFIDGRPVKVDLCEKCYGKKEGLPPLMRGIPEEIVRAIAESRKKEPAIDHLTVILDGKPVKIVLRDVPRGYRRQHSGHGDDKSGEAGSGQKG